MAVRRLSLSEAYLELQVAKRRSFFVYPGKLGLLRRVEARIGSGEVFAPARMGLGRRMSGAALGSGSGSSTGSLGSAGGAQVLGSVISEVEAAAAPSPPPYSGGARPAAKSVLFATGAVMAPPVMVPSQGQGQGAVTRAGRPGARTSPWLPSFGDHQSWFNDPRFDGSFPSRVLPFLYLGNLNHASNAYMLHALGIMHVVSVGECALVPPPGHCTSTATTTRTRTLYRARGQGTRARCGSRSARGGSRCSISRACATTGSTRSSRSWSRFASGLRGRGRRAGRCSCIVGWGCRGVRLLRFAYVMKHLSLPLVDAYLIVRSRRLSVLIQPNMRLLYNLCGWEIKLAKERARDDEARLRKELARTLTWPYLAKEVHALNEKYLH
ncbi:hypothetical protein C8R46DRAFT_518720 [Mycena filopes]|nr:hypothetical protein C8R46DRAFT_518720 [Mycena filopes]